MTPTDVHELLRSKLLPQFCKHSESVDLLHKSLLPHVWRVPSSKALSCKHERLFDLLTLASWYANECICMEKKRRTKRCCSLRAIRKTALSALSAASQLIFAHEMALPSYIHAGRFSCEHEICPQNVRVNCNYKTRQK